MKPRFEIGDRVIYKPCKLCGSVISSFHTAGICAVTFDEDGLPRHIYENDLEFENPKAAFLTRLQELLATFDAVINVGWNNGWQTDDAEYPLIDMDVVFKDGTGFCYDNVLDRSITAENVFDYDKD